MSSNRRATLGPVSSSTLNSRLSLGPAKTNDNKLSSSRMSIGGILNQTTNSNIGGFSNTGRPSYLNSSRKSLSIQQQQQQQSSLLSSTTIASGTATSGQSRTNNISSASRLPDPRSIGEKQFMNNSIRQLIDYLTKHSYDGAISPKILSKPTNKDFMNITLFLFKQYDPNYKFTGKFEDEMITMFKYLGYPFNICKSNISAVGSPHAWPTLLACIMWLVELLNYNEVCDAISNNNNNNSNNIYDGNQQVSSSSEVDDENTNNNNNNNNNQDPSSSEKAFYRYLGKAYQLFLSGKDDQYSQLESQFINYFNNKNILIQDQIETYEKRNHALQYEIETIKKRSLYLPELITKKKEFQINFQQFTTLIEELKKHRNQMKDKRDDKLNELNSLNQIVKALQGISNDDASDVIVER
jgi:kinetochore protein NDC80